MTKTNPTKPESKMTSKEITITATSGGSGGGNKAQIDLDGREIGFGNYSRGINVAVFEEKTGKPLFYTTFDTALSAQDLFIGDIFADFINSLPTGRIVALAVKGDAGELTEKAKAALKSIGSGKIDQLQRYQSYALIGIKGQEPDTASESIDWLEVSSSADFDVEKVKWTGGFVVEAISKPSTLGGVEQYWSVTGGEAEIKLNGNLLPIEEGTKPGWNLVVLDGKDGQVKSSGSFNPSISAEVDKMVETIQNLGAGEIVAIATKDYALPYAVEQKVIKACSSIGGILVGKLPYGGGWAIVGHQGAKPGKAVESLSTYCPPEDRPQGVAVKYWVLPTAPLGKELKLGQRLPGNVAKSASNYSTAIDGDYAVTGGHYYEKKVHIFQWQDGQWQLQQLLQGRDQYFGYSADISGNYVIVGAYKANVSSKNNCGAAYIYELKDGRWQLEQTLQPQDLQTGDYFGYSAAIDGKYAIVGAHTADASGKKHCGAAYIFHLEEGVWVQKAKLQPDDLEYDDLFGYSVAIDGNTAIVGAINVDSQRERNCGAAYIFHLEGDKWEGQKKLQPKNLEKHHYFGYSVAISRNRAIVGAVYYKVPFRKQDIGAAYIYQLEGGQWQFHQQILASDGTAKAYFGISVGIGDDLATVGASGANAVYLFQLVGGEWVQKQKLAPNGGINFGRRLSFDGSRALVGGNGFAYICDFVTSE